MGNATYNHGKNEWIFTLTAGGTAIVQDNVQYQVHIPGGISGIYLATSGHHGWILNPAGKNIDETMSIAPLYSNQSVLPLLLDKATGVTHRCPKCKNGVQLKTNIQHVALSGLDSCPHCGVTVWIDVYKPGSGTTLGTNTLSEIRF